MQPFAFLYFEDNNFVNMHKKMISAFKMRCATVVVMALMLPYLIF
jgi:hypothetical protein